MCQIVVGFQSVVDYSMFSKCGRFPPLLLRSSIVHAEQHPFKGSKKQRELEKRTRFTHCYIITNRIYSGAFQLIITASSSLDSLVL